MKAVQPEDLEITHIKIYQPLVNTFMKTCDDLSSMNSKIILLTSEGLGE